MEPSVGAGRLPSWNLTKARHRPCPVCNHDDSELICYRPDELPVARCIQCEMIYLPEIPDPREVSAFYEKYGDFKGLGLEVLSRPKLAKARLTDRHVAILLNSGGLKGSTLIDVGCSHGRFLQMARYCGANVIGIEIDKAACASLQQLNIQNYQDLSVCRPADVVCAFQLLEHLEMPQEFCSEVCNALTEDGRLLLALPNGGEVEQIGESWVGFRVDLEHFNYFSLKTLARLLGRYNLFIEQFWFHSQPNIPRSSSPFLGRSATAPILRRILGRTLGYPGHNEIAGGGSFVLTVLARKICSKPR